jgi:hypothetical protein
MKCKKVGIAADDVRGAASNREFKEFIVFGVAANHELLSNVNPFSFARQYRDKSLNVILIDVSVQVLSA